MLCEFHLNKSFKGEKKMPFLSQPKIAFVILFSALPKTFLKTQSTNPSNLFPSLFPPVSSSVWIHPPSSISNPRRQAGKHEFCTGDGGGCWEKRGAEGKKIHFLLTGGGTDQAQLVLLISKCASFTYGSLR